jgi:hypothetical protein
VNRERVVSVRLNAEESAALDRIGGPSALRRLIADLVRPPAHAIQRTWTGVAPVCVHWSDGSTGQTYPGAAA